MGESSIKRCKAMKTPNLVDAFWCWPLNNRINHTLINLKTINRYNKAKKQNSISETITLLLVDIQLILPQSIENKS
jgi:hypothetical protein